MQSIVIPVGVGVALLASCGLAAAQGHMQGFGGGGGMHAPGGGGFHAPGGGGGFRSGPSMAPRGTLQAPRAYGAERAPRMEHGYRTEHSRRTYNERARRAESPRVKHSQR